MSFNSSYLKSSLRFLRRRRRVIYTCLFGYSEGFNDFEYPTAKDIDFVCFTDDPELRSSFWTVRLIEPGLLDPSRAAKQIKAMPHRFFPNHDCSLYIDNTVRLKADPKRLFAELLDPSPSPFVCFRHHERDCVYDEAEAVIELGFDDPNRVNAQMQFYRRLGYPAKNGLAKCAFILRNHHDRALWPVMERWHQQVLLYSKRDQLSLNPVAWFDKLKIGYIEHRFDDFQLLEWPCVKNNIRLPRDFDEDRYMRLNPDVTSNARRHYLLFGATEGRRY